MKRRRLSRRPPTPGELLVAPEMAILLALEATIDLAIVALVAAQPELHATHDARDAISTPAASRADLVITKAQELAAALAAYRITRDLPF